MAVVNVLSPLITNRDASPGVANRVTVDGARLRTVKATVAVTNGDSIASIFRMVSVPSNAVIESIKVFCDAITSAEADIGLYQTTANGSAVLDVDAYASAQSIASASKVGIECAFEARDIIKVAQEVWQDGGLTADSQRFYDIALTLTAAATATGDVTMIVHYSTP